LNARNQLNLIYLSVAAVIASVIGVIFSSWLVFGLALAAVVGIAISERAIRPRFR